MSGTGVSPLGFGDSGPLTMTVGGVTAAEVATTGSLKTAAPAFVFDSFGQGFGAGTFVQSGRKGTTTCTTVAWALYRLN